MTHFKAIEIIQNLKFYHSLQQTFFRRNESFPFFYVLSIFPLIKEKYKKIFC